MINFKIGDLFYKESNQYDGCIDLVFKSSERNSDFISFDGIELILVHKAPELGSFENISDIFKDSEKERIISSINEDEFGDIRIHLQDFGVLTIMSKLNFEEKVTQQISFSQLP